MFLSTMSRRLIAGLAAAALLAGAAATTAGGGSKPRCPAGRVADADRGGRVVGARGKTYWVCLAGRRPVPMEVDSPRNRVSRTDLVSPYVGYGLSVQTTAGSGDEVALVNVPKDDARDASVDGDLAALVVSRRGVLVFLGTGADGRPPQLSRLGFDGVSELDRGAIEPGSLAVSRDGRTAYWTRDGVVRSAAL
jgi:ABC-type amino acid transport substrate-binding protein